MKRSFEEHAGAPAHGVVGAKVKKGIAKASSGGAAPQKKFFRQRAHINPLSTMAGYVYPISPDRMDWAAHYPALASALSGEGAVRPSVEVADVGCGFGGLLMDLAPLLQSSLLLGMEIRPKVTEYVRLRILAARRQAASSAAAAEGASYTNASVLKVNAMKYLPCFFHRGALSKMFFCFPDPHFKPTNHRRRIINTDLLSEYAYALREGGRLYTISDVKDLHNWMAAHGDAHHSFRRLTEAELAADPCVEVMRNATEEGKKVARGGGDNRKGEKYIAAFVRVSDVEAVQREAAATGGDFWSSPPVVYSWTPAPAQAKGAAEWGQGKRAGPSRPDRQAAQPQATSLAGGEAAV